MPDYQQRNNNTNSNSTSSSPATEFEPDEQDLVGNQAIVDIIKSQNESTGQRELNPNKNGIVFLGLNHFAHDEARKLNQINRGRGGAVAAKPQTKQDHIRKGGQEYDLTTEAGAAMYISTLGLPDQLAVDAATFLHAGGDKARDELAQFIRILSEAEMGERKIDRMVLSGHSVGSQIWGDDNGEIKFQELERLAEIFPNAMGQVKHLMLSACYAGGETKMNDHRDTFAGVESIFAYHKSSPGTWTGAMDHMEEWEKATRTGMDSAGVDPELAKGHRKAKNVSTWNMEDGYQGGKPMQFHQIRSSLDSQENVFQNFKSGNELVANSQTGPLRDYYNMIQRAINHPQAPAEYRDLMSQRRDITIRLLYFSLICEKFQHHYRKDMEADYEAAGVDMPDFSKMNRKEVLEHIEDFESKTTGTQALQLLQHGLRDLNSDIIPTSWV
ncbi:MAG: hypothetical protein VX278_19135 [Myxococcota bacterium]|nr:hypothetical protein [Myxococcota bacterium]